MKRRSPILAAGAILNDASKIERDPAKRRIYDLANVIKRARAWPLDIQPPNHYYRMSEWLLFDATPAELHALADALELEPQSIDPRRLKIIQAYGEALQESDHQFRWRNLLELEMPGDRIIAGGDPLPFKDRIKSPPTWGQFKATFVRLFGTQCLPERYSVKKTLTNIYGLPLAASKRGRPRK
jgi:hypothetical protein